MGAMTKVLVKLTFKKEGEDETAEKRSERHAGEQLTSRVVHDRRNGVCRVPRQITPASQLVAELPDQPASLSRSPAGCIIKRELSRWLPEYPRW